MACRLIRSSVVEARGRVTCGRHPSSPPTVHGKHSCWEWVPWARCDLSLSTGDPSPAGNSLQPPWGTRRIRRADHNVPRKQVPRHFRQQAGYLPTDVNGTFRRIPHRTTPCKAVCLHCRQARYGRGKDHEKRKLPCPRRDYVTVESAL